MTEIFTVERENKPSLEFEGDHIAEVATDASPGRETRLALYRTTGGKYIAHQASYTSHDDERDRHKAAVCETQADVIDFFGHRWLSKELYEAAGINAAEQVK